MTFYKKTAIMAAFFLVFTLFFTSLIYAGDTSMNTMVSVVKGKVHLKNKAELKVLDITNAEPVNVGYRIMVQNESRGVLKYSDGTKLNLAPGTELALAIGGVKIKKGRAWMYFSKQKKRFVIQTPSAVMGILGTTLNVDVNKDNSTTLTVFSGKVSIKAGTDEKIITAGKMARAYPNGKIETSPAKKEKLKNWENLRNSVEPVGDLNNKIKGLGLDFIPKKNDMPKSDSTVVSDSTGFGDTFSSSAANEITSLKNIEANSEKNKSKITKILGDINNDSSVDTLDVEQIRLHIAKKAIISEDQKEKADINGDGTVDRQDMMILNYKARGIGDFNRDGNVDDDDLLDIEDAADRESEDSLFDINGDGKVNSADIHYFKRIKKQVKVFNKD